MLRTQMQMDKLKRCLSTELIQMFYQQYLEALIEVNHSLISRIFLQSQIKRLIRMLQVERNDFSN